MAHNPENINNISDNTSEVVENDKNKNSLRKKIIALGLAASIAISLGGCGEDKPGAPSEAGPAFDYEEFQPDSPICISVTEMGLDKFVEKYGKNYDDPEFAYEALQSYEGEHNGESIFINPDYLTLFNGSDKPGEIIGSNNYSLGFESFKMPLETGVSYEYTEKLFNEYTLKQMDRCMNMISCNPGATDLIRSEFLSQYPKNDPLDGYSIIEQGGESFYETIEGIVSKYGYFVEYYTNEASSSDEITVFSTKLEPEPDYINYNKHQGIESSADIVISAYDYSQLDEDNMPLEHLETLTGKILDYFRIPESRNSDGSIVYSDKTVIGIR